MKEGLNGLTTRGGGNALRGCRSCPPTSGLWEKTALGAQRTFLAPATEGPEGSVGFAWPRTELLRSTRKNKREKNISRSARAARSPAKGYGDQILQANDALSANDPAEHFHERFAPGDLS